MHRTALIALLALTMVLGTASQALSQEADPAQVAPPITMEGVQGDAKAGTALLEGGSASLAASATRGSIDVWTKRVPCVDKDDNACFTGQASTSRSSIDASGGTVSITPRKGDATHGTGLIAGNDATISFEAEQATLGLKVEDETVRYTPEDDAPQGMRQIALERGAELRLPEGGNLTVQGAFQFNSYDSILTVNVNESDGDRRLVTGWTWEQGDDFQWYHVLTLVRGKIDGAVVAPWDSKATVSAELPMSASTDAAQVRVQQGQLGEASPDTGNTTLEDVDLTVTGIRWNDDVTAQSSSETPAWRPTYGQEARSEPAGTFLVELGTQQIAPPDQPQDEAVSTQTVVGAGAAALLVAGLTAYYWPRLSWLGTVVFLPLYSRIEKDEILENEVRETLYELVQDDPGIHAHALSEEADVGWGTTVYHLRRLERNGFVTSEKRGRYRRFFPAAGFLARQREVLSVLQNETTNDIARLILREPGLNQKAICEELDISPSLANWHINRLLDADLVERERRGRTVHYTPGPAWQDIKDAVDLDDAALDEAVTA